MGGNASIADVDSSDSTQSTTQNNISETTTTSETNISDKQTNIQDYITYIRTTSRTTQEMEQSFNAKVSSVTEMRQKNNAVITGCVAFDDELDIDQQNISTQKVKSGFEQLIEISNKLRNNEEVDIQKITSGTQGSGTDSKSNSDVSHEGDSSNDANKSTDKSTFIGKLLKEGFGIFRLKERGLFPLVKVDDSTTTQESWQNNEQRMISQTILNNNSELYNRVSTAYDNCTEIVKEVKEKINTEVSSTQQVSGIQENNFEVHGGANTGCGVVFTSKVKVKQANELKQSSEMSVMFNMMSKMDVDNLTAAIMADMMGFGQEAKSSLDSSASVKDKLSTNNTDDDTLDKHTSQTKSIVLYIAIGVAVIAVIAIVGFILYKFLSDNPQIVSDALNNNDDGGDFPTVPNQTQFGGLDVTQDEIIEMDGVLY